jgi:hypothetical protein
MLLVGSEGKATNPHRLGREWGAPRGIGMECRNRSLRPGEMSELLAAPEWNGMLLIASEGKATTPHRLGREWGAPRPIGMECRDPSLRPNEMSELLTAPEWNGMLLIASEGEAATPHRIRKEWHAPQGMGMECQNPPLRPNEMSELLCASE